MFDSLLEHPALRSEWWLAGTAAGKKTVFWATFDLNVVILSRQARDKRRENSKKNTAFLQAAARARIAEMDGAETFFCTILC